MKNVKRMVKTLVLTGLFSYALVSHSTGMPVFDGVNWIQNATIAKRAAESLIQQGKQLKYQLEMLQHQKEQLKALPHYHWRDASHFLKELDSVQKQSDALASGIRDWQQQFNQLYREFDTNHHSLVDNFSTVQRRQKATLDTLETALGTNYVTAKSIPEEQRFLQEINTQARQATTPLQTAQVHSALQAENVQQLQTIKRLLLNQMNAQQAVLSNTVSEQAHQDTALHKMITSMPTEFPTYRGNPNFGLITTR
jgi:P-type conjugative transfer protein TrbJ